MVLKKKLILFIIMVIAATLFTERRKCYQDSVGNAIEIVKPRCFCSYYYCYFRGSRIYKSPIKMNLTDNVRVAFTDSTIAIWTSNMQQLDLPDRDMQSTIEVYYGYEAIDGFNNKYLSSSNAIWEWWLLHESTPQYWNHSKWEPCSTN